MPGTFSAAFHNTASRRSLERRGFRSSLLLLTRRQGGFDWTCRNCSRSLTVLRLRVLLLPADLGTAACSSAAGLAAAAAAGGGFFGSFPSVSATADSWTTLLVQLLDGRHNGRGATARLEKGEGATLVVSTTGLLFGPAVAKQPGFGIVRVAVQRFRGGPHNGVQRGPQGRGFFVGQIRLIRMHATLVQHFVGDPVSHPRNGLFLVQQDGLDAATVVSEGG